MHVKAILVSSFVFGLVCCHFIDNAAHTCVQRAHCVLIRLLIFHIVIIVYNIGRCDCCRQRWPLHICLVKLCCCHRVVDNRKCNFWSFIEPIDSIRLIIESHLHCKRQTQREKDSTIWFRSERTIGTLRIRWTFPRSNGFR